MATLKQRLHRKNSSGSYDTIYLETSASLVKMDDGTTLTNKISSMDTAINGKAASNHTHSGYAASSHNHDDRYYTEAEVNNLMAGKQDASTAINTGNIGSQTVNYANGANYANSAGNTDTVDGWHVNLDPGSWGIKPICAGTGDMAAGSTALSNGHIYLVYE